MYQFLLLFWPNAEYKFPNHHFNWASAILLVILDRVRNVDGQCGLQKIQWITSNTDEFRLSYRNIFIHYCKTSSIIDYSAVGVLGTWVCFWLSSICSMYQLLKLKECHVYFINLHQGIEVKKKQNVKSNLFALPVSGKYFRHCAASIIDFVWLQMSGNCEINIQNMGHQSIFKANSCSWDKITYRLIFIMNN